jgi:hypothetical protein
VDAPAVPTQGEQDLVMYDLYQKYLQIFEGLLEDLLEDIGVGEREFFEQLMDVSTTATFMQRDE